MKKTIFTVLFITFSTVLIYSQEMADIKIMDWPEELEYEGRVVAIDKWEDNNGVNYFIVSKVAEYVSKKATDEYEVDEVSSYLYGYHYIEDGDGYRLSRKVTDYIKDCVYDVVIYFEPYSMEITDLDNDGINEVSYIYKLACISDVSPYDMKLMLLEDGDKYPVRGKSLISYGDDYTEGGNKTFGEEFSNAPKAFKDFAEEQWNKFQLTIE